MLPMTPRVRGILEGRWKLAGEPLEGWVWPAPTRSGHIEPSSLKKQHAKAIKISKVREFVLHTLRVLTAMSRLGEHSSGHSEQIGRSALKQLVSPQNDM